MALAESFRQQTGEASDPLDDPEVLNDRFLQAERGKALTQRDKAPFRVTHAGHQARVGADRVQFERSGNLLDRTIETTRDMLRDAEAKRITKFDKIILVGSATRMPQVRNRLVAEFDMEARELRPGQAVAKGIRLKSRSRTRSRRSWPRHPSTANRPPRRSTSPPSPRPRC